MPPTATAITTDAKPGPNVVNFPGVSDVLNVAEGLVHESEQAQKAGIDPAVAQSLVARLQSVFDFLAREHSADSRFGQAMNVMKRASEALMKREMPTEAMAGTKPETWLATIELTPPEAELHNLCASQVALREGLQTRVLRTCLSCRHQQITNPDYEQMMDKKKQMEGFWMAQRNLLMAMQRMKASPKFVCRRCQGMEFLDRTIVLCPECGVPDTGVLLSRCPKCGHEFTNASADAPAATPALPPEKKGPPPKMLTGKCADCGNRFRIPVDKIPEQGLKAKCSGCGRPLTIRRPKAV